MVNKYRILISKSAKKDKEKIKSIPTLKKKADNILAILRQNPYRNPPPYEKLVGDLKTAYFRRINIQHRLVYQIFEEEKTIKIISMWSHYEF